MHILEFTMTLPHAESYRDIVNAQQTRTLSMKNIHDYLRSDDKVFEEKYKKLYEERFIRYARSSSLNQLHYVTGSVWAEMRKAVSYKVDISLDDHGVVSEAQCECGADQGPTAHCKHVITVLYGLHRLAVDETIVTEQTCTQVLQTFYHVKPYAGDPMSTEDLEGIRGTSFVFDPRPSRYVNSSHYQDHSRNTVVGFKSDDLMPVNKLFPPANPYALSDHSFSLTPEHLFLQRELVSQITDDEIISLELNTYVNFYLVLRCFLGCNLFYISNSNFHDCFSLL